MGATPLPTATGDILTDTLIAARVLRTRYVSRWRGPVLEQGDELEVSPEEWAWATDEKVHGTPLLSRLNPVPAGNPGVWAEPFDGYADATVPEIIAALLAGGDPEDLDYVAMYEKAHKKRTTLLEWLADERELAKGD